MDKEHAFFRVQAAGDILGQLGEGPLPQSRRVLADGDGVQVGHEEIAVKFRNHLRPVVEGAQVVAQMQVPAGLDAGDHNLLLIFHKNKHLE